MDGILYVVATPIGNLSDISERALETLKRVSFVVCEDTRVTKKLLAHYNINVPTLSYHHHSSLQILNSLIGRLKAGEAMAYVSDAGTPGISDPGGKLVEQAIANNINVVPIPGPSAVTVALSVAGLSIQNYLFLGFPPHKKGRQTFFKKIVASEYPIIFYESTHRIIKALQELGRLMPKRNIVVCRELTKKFETIYRGEPSEIVNQLNKSSTKGEFVVIVSVNNL
jgi:16S rRNA (cytidine1402-2'-O)-methyltransferase